MRTYRAIAPTAATAIFLAVGSLPVHGAGSCQTLTDAYNKAGLAPAHLYMTEVAASRGNQPRTSETINLGDANGTMYLTVNGQWRRSPVSAKELQAARARANSLDKAACEYLRDDVVNGGPATVYHIHQEDVNEKRDTTVWVSKGAGLPQRAEIDVDAGGAAGKSHLSLRWDYKNVQAPTGVK